MYYLLLSQTVIKENTHSFILSLSKYFLNLYYVPGTILGAGGYISKEKDPCRHGAYSLVQGDQNEPNKQII